MENSPVTSSEKDTSAHVNMPVTRCRVCGHPFFEEPLLRYEHMPGAAQYLPDAESLGKDVGVALEVCQCAGCGLVQLTNAPVPYYREVIRAAAVSAEMTAFRLRQFGDFVRKYGLTRKKVIEIGCGRGEFLSLMQQHDVDAYGIEYSPESVKIAVANGLRVSQGYIDHPSCRLHGAPFDAFFILNFLEHMPDQNSALDGICNNLTDGAVGLVEVPNFDMIVHHDLFSEFIGDHLFYFTRDTLIAALQSHGFEILECTVVWYDYIISVVVRKRARLDLSRFQARRMELKTEMEAYLLRFAGGKVAIWGAGHQAFAVIALTGIADRIRYVVDSAPFKQGKYTPATHIPIVSPDTLESDPVDAVIIMAASYSDEVARIIRERFGRGIQMCILRDFGLETV